jgi:hypothetical protein
MKESKEGRKEDRWERGDDVDVFLTKDLDFCTSSGTSPIEAKNR